MYIRHDVQSAISMIRGGELSLTDWVQSVRGRRVYAVWSPSDPLPFLSDIFETTSMVLKGRKRKRLRT